MSGGPFQSYNSSSVPGTNVSPIIYDAIVDASGADGTHPLISDALAAGANSIFVREGTYIETVDLDLTPGIQITGEGPGLVIVNFAGTDSSFVMDGSGRRITTGTITVATGSTSVQGAGTSFTTLQAGDYIRLGAVWSKIESVADDVNLTLSRPYNGTALAGVSFVAQSMFVGGGIDNLVIAGSLGPGVEVIQGIHILLRDLALNSCGLAAGPSLILQRTVESFCITMSVEEGGGDGFYFTECDIVSVTACVSRNNAGHGYRTSSCEDFSIDAVFSMANGIDGILSEGTTRRLVISDSVLCQNDGDGISTGNSTLSATIGSCNVFENGGYGIDFGGSKNVVDGCTISGNGIDGILVGDNGVVDGNHVSENVGIGIQAQNDNECTFSDNIVHDNGSDGMRIGPNNSATGNRCYDNGGDGIEVRGSRCAVVGNRCSGNANYGIEVRNGKQNTVVVGNQLQQNTTGSLLDNGAGTVEGTALTNAL